MSPRIRIDPSTRMPLENEGERPDAKDDITKELTALRRTIESRPRRYVELSVRTSFSFLSGASPPEYIVFRAAEIGYDTIAITDRDGLYGIVRACEEATKHGIRIIVGCELTLEREGLEGVPDVPGKPTTLTVLVEDHVGYKNLCEILTESHRRHPKSVPLNRKDGVNDAASAGELRLPRRDTPAFAGGPVDEDELPRNTFAGVPLSYISARAKGLWALVDAALL